MLIARPKLHHGASPSSAISHGWGGWDLNPCNEVENLVSWTGLDDRPDWEAPITTSDRPAQSHTTP